MDYREAVEYLLSFTDLERGVRRSGDPAMSLASMRSLLSRLNNPQVGRGTVHVTGSKGKGSTAAMIDGVLRRSGLATARFSSPHLHSFTERIALDGDAVSPEEFAAALAAIRPAVDAEQASVHGNVSTFGVLTALFFWLVRAQTARVDWQVVEVGLGGTFDTTNVFERPDVVVITPISLEHTEILGDTCAKIAADKAGLIKPGSTCVMAAQRDAGAAEVVRARCREVGAELVDVAAAYDVTLRERFAFGQSFLVEGPEGVRRLRSPMLGLHQAENAATAVATADALRRQGHAISETAIADGIAHARVRGRLEVMGQAPLIVADGAHNGESAARLAEALRTYFDWVRCVVVLGVLADKDVAAIGRELAPLAKLVVCARLQSPRTADPAQVAEIIAALGPTTAAAESVPAALAIARSFARPGDAICITGSLYTVAEARESLLGAE